jgi:predicted DNA-binding protein (MmcQ/YjbR family)
MKELEALAQRLRQRALGYPETYEEAPWGDRVVKVRGKIFFFCGVHAKQLYVTVKLPATGRALLARDYAEPTHYGMGKHGWVTSKFNVAGDVPRKEVERWIDESFRAVAPKTLVSALTDDAGTTSAKTDGGRAGVAGAKKARSSPPAGADGTRIAAVEADAAAKPDGGKTAKAKAVKAVLFCLDPIRAERAVQALAARKIACAVATDAAKLALGRARVLIVDVGRQPQDGLALAARVDASDAAVHLFVAGVRDAEQARRLRALGSAEAFRVPPGDDRVADAVARALASA